MIQIFIFCLGYIAWKGEKEENKEETPVKKYQRLNCEVRHILYLSLPETQRQVTQHPACPSCWEVGTNKVKKFTVMKC
jgi:hypothetical protein